jgi:hypothetical protein
VLAGDLLGAVADGVVGGLVEELVEAADHAAGALVQVLRLGGQGAGLVAVQPQGRLQRRDELGPFGAVGERPGTDQLAAAGELAAAGAGEDPAPLDVDPGVVLLTELAESFSQFR